MKNIIMINLTKFNKEKLKEVADNCNIEYENLLQNKKDGVSNIWIDTTTNYIIAYSTKLWKDNIFMTEEFLTDLENMKCFKPKSKLKVVLDIDAILDKVNKHGMKSLSKKETDFLKNQ